jgi:hypothetical protein
MISVSICSRSPTDPPPAALRVIVVSVATIVAPTVIVDGLFSSFQ